MNADAITERPPELPEVAKLRKHEAVIERGKETFLEVGAALFSIKKEKLYRTAGFMTFQAYCKERWGWSRQRAYQLINATSMADLVSDVEAHRAGEVARHVNHGLHGRGPSNERQARELTKLPESKDRQAAWREAEKAARVDKKPVTLRHVKAAVDRRRPASEAAGAGDSPPPTTDRLGHTLPNLAASSAFARSHELTELARLASKIKTAVAKLIKADDPLVRFINPGRFDADIINVRNALNGAAPYSVCPYCGGEGCKVCGRDGWVNKLTYDQAPSETKDALER